MRLRRQLEAAQLQWARRRGLALRRDEHGNDLGQVERLEDNLFPALDEETRAQLMGGAGGELNPPAGVQGHLFSLASSTALCLNFFLPWKGRDTGPLVEAMGLEADGGRAMEFDARLRLSKHRVEAPAVDLLLKPPRAGATAIAVEAKFCEPYDGKPRPPLPAGYVKRLDLLDGWPRLARLARALGSPEAPAFRHLHASQTLRQVMGLRRHFGRAGFALVHLWYDIEGEAGRAYEAELDEFRWKARQDGVAFSSLSWQQLFEKVRHFDSAWSEYLRERYGVDRRPEVR
jgi:hypothetical protein